MSGSASLDPKAGRLENRPGLQHEGKESHRGRERVCTPDQPRHRHGGVCRPGILGRLCRRKKENRSSQTDHKKIHKYLPPLEGRWPYRQGAPGELGIPEIIRIA